VTAGHTERTLLTMARRSLLGGLVSGDIEIPESYDSLLAEAM
jgi:hypothetical protein